MVVAGYRGAGGSRKTAHLGVSSFLPQDPRIELRLSRLSMNISTHWDTSPDSFSTDFMSVAAQIPPRADGHPHRRVWLCPVDIVTQAITSCWVPCALSGHLSEDSTYPTLRRGLTESLQDAVSFLLAAAALHLSRELASSLWTMHALGLFPNVTFLLNITLPNAASSSFLLSLLPFFSDFVLKLPQLFRGPLCGPTHVWDFIVSFNSWNHCPSSVWGKHTLNALWILVWSLQQAY